jgi:hypothetical protein
VFFVSCFHPSISVAYVFATHLFTAHVSATAHGSATHGFTTGLFTAHVSATAHGSAIYGFAAGLFAAHVSTHASGSATYGFAAGVFAAHVSAATYVSAIYVFTTQALCSSALYNNLHCFAVLIVPLTLTVKFCHFTAHVSAAAIETPAQNLR